MGIDSSINVVSFFPELKVTLFGDTIVDVLFHDGLISKPMEGPKNTLVLPIVFCRSKSIMIIGNDADKACSLTSGTIMPFASLTLALSSVTVIDAELYANPNEPLKPQSVGIHSIFPMIPNNAPVPLSYVGQAGSPKQRSDPFVECKPNPAWMPIPTWIGLYNT